MFAKSLSTYIYREREQKVRNITFLKVFFFEWLSYTHQHNIFIIIIINLSQDAGTSTLLLNQATLSL